MYYDHLRVIIRNGPAHSGEPSILLWQDPNLLVRGQTYHMDIQAFLLTIYKGLWSLATVRKLSITMGLLVWRPSLLEGKVSTRTMYHKQLQ